MCNLSKNAMSWIIVMLLVLIIILLSVCIYLDIEFTSAFTSSDAPNTTEDSTTTQPIINTINPIDTTQTTTTTKRPAQSSAPIVIQPPNTAITPITSTVPVTTTKTPITTKTPQTTKPVISPDAPTICIDPGHGFSDPGALGSLNGITYNEKDINLAISLKLKEELLSLGYNVIMTHDGVNLPADKYLTKTKEDTYFYVNQRNQWIKDRKSEIDLVISIHCDSAAPSVSGTRFYILSTKMTGYTAKSVTLAEKLFDATHLALGTTSLPANKYNTQELAVLKTGIPSVLLEAAFLSSKSDLTKLIDPAWQAKLAQGLAQGVKNYLAK